MINVLLHGFSGAMGEMVNQQLKKYHNVHIWGYEKEVSVLENVYHRFDDIINKIDVIIDFSHFTLVDDLLDYAIKNSIPTVICTTGLTQITEEKILLAKSIIPMFKSGNMSLGINVLLELVKLGAQALGDYDVEIIEKHHNQKVDAPSGTAYMIADQIKNVRSELVYQYGREGNHCKRLSNELGIHAIRGGSITGEHTVLFAGLDEVIEIKHQATSKTVFAKGAIEAAFFLLNKKPGLYNMSDLIQGGTNEF